ncbi:hypothetical protein PHLCEN_2v6174 [Hermanssonia centrifuga]|uniref:Uncharacterized protein n=1 Tax=Hermanssonia centrifuga TaxID=98765 RepID=A0A2R6P0T4_9APHY|nr:hypothetical protein PHLCEN_2v6174 [Hermanssonia centrifuga]
MLSKGSWLQREGRKNELQWLDANAEIDSLDIAAGGHPARRENTERVVFEKCAPCGDDVAGPFPVGTKTEWTIGVGLDQKCRPCGYGVPRPPNSSRSSMGGMLPWSLERNGGKRSERKESAVGTVRWAVLKLEIRSTVSIERGGISRGVVPDDEEA